MGNPEHRSKVATVLEDRDFSRVDSGEIVDLVKQHGTLERTRDLARRYAERARMELRPFPDNLARRALETVPELILSRDR